MELKEGKHEIEWELGNGNWGMGKQKIKLVLVNKKERKKAEKLIRKKIDNPRTKIAYIFSKKDNGFYVP